MTAWKLTVNPGWESLTASFQDILWFNRSKHLLIFGSGIAGLCLVWNVYSNRKKAQRREKWKSVGKDVVVLHQFPRSRFVPSMSPFPLKVETYLRMTGIPYQNDFIDWCGPKGKTPWITLNEEDIADSQLCLEFLARKFHKDFSSHLTPEEQSITRAFQIMAEEHLFWVLVLWRFIFTKAKTMPLIQPNMSFFDRQVIIPLVGMRWKQAAHGQGIGRHTEAEIIEMGVKDLRSISRFLGTKSFFTGDKPIEMDCAMFGLLSQMLWAMPDSPFEHLMNGEFINLKNYCVRMKETFWPDWDQQCI